MSARRVQVGDLALNVELRGPEGAPPVVLLHGFPMSHRMWAPQLDALEGSWRLVAPDARGHGASDAGDGQTFLEFMVDDLLGILDALGIEKTVGCGLSMGGYVLLRAYERAPERFRALVLADTKSAADDDKGRLARATTARLVGEEGVPAFADRFLEKLVGPATHAERPGVVAGIRELITANTPLGIKGALLALATRTDTTATLAKVSVPTLVLVGDEDGLTPPAAARDLADRIPGARLVTIPRAGHVSNLEHPEPFTAALRSFLDGLGVAGA